MFLLGSAYFTALEVTINYAFNNQSQFSFAKHSHDPTKGLYRQTFLDQLYPAVHLKECSEWEEGPINVHLKKYMVGLYFGSDQ